MNTIGFTREQNNKFYGGIIDVAGLRLIGFCFIALAQIIMITIFSKLSDALNNPELLFDGLESFNLDLIKPLNTIANVGKPLIIISLFNKVFIKKEKPFKGLIIAAIFAIIFYIAEVIFFNYFFVIMLYGTIAELGIPLEPQQVMFIFDQVDGFITGFANLNIFLDLTICFLIYIFLFYKPKKLEGKKLIAFRFLTAIPIAYIVFSFIISALNKTGVYRHENVFLGAAITKGNISTFLIFGLILTFMKLFKIYYDKKGYNTPYSEFVETNKYSLCFAIFIAIALAIVSIFEFGFSFVDGIKDFGIGKNYWLFLGIPFVLMFDINSKPFGASVKALHIGWMTFHYFIYVVMVMDTVFVLSENIHLIKDLLF